MQPHVLITIFNASTISSSHYLIPVPLVDEHELILFNHATKLGSKYSPSFTHIDHVMFAGDDEGNARKMMKKMDKQNTEVKLSDFVNDSLSNAHKYPKSEKDARENCLGWIQCQARFASSSGEEGKEGKYAKFKMCNAELNDTIIESLKSDKPILISLVFSWQISVTDL
jgi:hypothetical protein